MLMNLFGACEKAPQMLICPKTFVHDCRFRARIRLKVFLNTRRMFKIRGTYRITGKQTGIAQSILHPEGRGTMQSNTLKGTHGNSCHIFDSSSFL